VIIMKLVINILFLSLCLTSGSAGQDLDDYLMRSAASIENKQYGLTIELCSKALKTETDYRIYLLLAEAHQKSGTASNAIEYYQQANKLKSGSGDMGLAIIYAGQDHEKSIVHLERHLKSDNKIPRSEIILDPAFSILQKTDEWKNLWKRSWYTELERGISEANYLIDNGRLDELNSLEDHLIPVYRDDPGMNYLLGIVSSAKSDYKSSIGLFKQSLEGGYSTPEAWNLYIDALIEEKNYFEAVNACENAISLYPEKPALILLRANANRKAGDRSRAIDDVKLFLELYPESEEGLSMAGRLMNENRSYSEALKYYSRSIDLYPGNPDNFIDRADVYSRTLTWEYAIYDYSMALDLRPADGDVYYRKGVALMKSGRLDDACRDLKMALKYGYKKAAAEINKNCIR
jgi:tetratricopeptide (TPR) repeat protein